MGKDHTTVLGIALGAIVAVVMTEGLFSLWDVMIGVVCLTIMVTISHSTERTGSIAWGYATVFGLCVLLSVGGMFDAIFHGEEWWVSARFKETVLI